jgi:hypothetical protein
MRSVVLFGPLALVTCSTVPLAPPVHGVTPGRVCTTDGTAQYIGQPATEESGTAILRATNAAVLRWAAPGMMLTMDYRADRVTVRFAPDRKITAINCG